MTNIWSTREILLEEELLLYLHPGKTRETGLEVERSTNSMCHNSSIAKKSDMSSLWLNNTNKRIIPCWAVWGWGKLLSNSTNSIKCFLPEENRTNTLSLIEHGAGSLHQRGSMGQMSSHRGVARCRLYASHDRGEISPSSSAGQPCQLLPSSSKGLTHSL